MPLSETELERVYSTLAEAARECGLDWVLEQVEERIAVGKTRIEKIPVKYAEALAVISSESKEEYRSNRGAPANFVTSEPYSAAERAELLVEALLLAVPTAHQVAQYTLAGISEFGPIKSVLFAPDVPSSQPHEIRPDDLEKRTRVVTRVENLLKELQLELQDGSQARPS